MTVFFIAAALLVLAAMLFIVPPLLRREADPDAESTGDRRELNISIYRDQLKELERDVANDVITRDQYEQSREELEQRLLEDVGEESARDGLSGRKLDRATVTSAVLVAAFVPVLAAGLYLELGEPAGIIDGGSGDAAPIVRAEDGTEVHDQISQMIAQLEQRLEREPNDPEGWSMLGRSYLWLEDFGRALGALERAVELNDRDPQLLVDYADALAMTGGMTLEGRPIELIERALSLDPRNEKGLWLAGTAAYERSDFAGALGYWQRLLALVPPGSDAARAMQNNIAEVEALMNGEEPPPPMAQVPAQPPGGAGGATVRGTVALDSALGDRLDPDATVFVFARAAEGPRMPLAVMRARAADLPLDYELDDSMAMDPSMSLSRFPEVVVVARVSRSGGAMVQSGDLQGESAPVRPGSSQPVEIVIDEVVP